MEKLPARFLKLLGLLVLIWPCAAAFRLGVVSANAALPVKERPLVADKTASDSVPVNETVPKLAEKERRLIELLIAEAHSAPSIGARMKLISARLLGAPYIVQPLKGSFTEPEEFVVRFDGFDCVTLIETVLALASAEDVDVFLKRLRAMRYANGVVSYTTRLHYTTDWSRANIQRGYLQDLTQGGDTIERAKSLNLLQGFQPRTEVLRFFPKGKLNIVSALLQDGDLIYFVSPRKGVDIYHVGLIFRAGGQLLLCHASRSKGKVIGQDLAEFIKTYPMLGFMVVRPLDQK